MTKEELKKEAKTYAKRKFNEEEQAYLHDIIAQTYLDGAEPREKRIADLEKENAELRTQVNEWLNAYSDTSLVKVLRDCIYKNEKLSSQEQQELSAWVECAMDFGSNLDECADQLTKATEIIKGLLSCCRNYPQENAEKMEQAEQFLKEIKE